MKERIKRAGKDYNDLFYARLQIISGGDLSYSHKIPLECEYLETFTFKGLYKIKFRVPYWLMNDVVDLAYPQYKDPDLEGVHGKYNLTKSVDFFFLQVYYDLEFGCVEGSDEDRNEEFDLFSRDRTHFVLWNFEPVLDNIAKKLSYRRFLNFWQVYRCRTSKAKYQVVRPNAQSQQKSMFE